MVYMFFAYYASTIAFLLPFYSFGAKSNYTGLYVDMWSVGLLIYFLCVMFTHVIFFLFIRDFSIKMVVFLFISYI